MERGERKRGDEWGGERRARERERILEEKYLTMFENRKVHYV